MDGFKIHISTSGGRRKLQSNGGGICNPTVEWVRNLQTSRSKRRFVGGHKGFLHGRTGAKVFYGQLEMVKL